MKPQDQTSIDAHHVDPSIIAEHKSAIIDNWKSFKQDIDCSHHLLKLGYMMQYYYHQSNPTQLANLAQTNVSEHQCIEHMAALMDVIQRRIELACKQENKSLLQHIFTPLSLALKQFRAVDQQGVLHQINQVWDHFNHLVLSSWSGSTVLQQLTNFNGQDASCQVAINQALVAYYEHGIDHLIASESKLQSIDQQINSLEAAIMNKNYQNGDSYDQAKYQACVRLISTYRDYRYLLLVDQKSTFHLHLGCSQELLDTLRQHKTHVGRLFSRHTPSIVEPVEHILQAISQIEPLHQHTERLRHF